MLDAEFEVAGFQFGEELTGEDAGSEVGGEALDAAGDACADRGLFLGEEGSGNGEETFDRPLGGLGERDGDGWWRGLGDWFATGAGACESEESGGEYTYAYHRELKASHGPYGLGKRKIRARSPSARPLEPHRLERGGDVLVAGPTPRPWRSGHRRPVS